MQLVTIDLETYYDKAYSLSKLTTEEYIRSPQFEAIGIAIKIGDSPAKWTPKPYIRDVLQAVEWSDSMAVGQNMAFDAAILSWHYGVKPKALGDTLGMSRALFPHEKSHSLKAQAERMGVGGKGTEVENALGLRYAAFSQAALARYGEYCANDADLTHALFTKYMALGFPLSELKLIDLTLRMFTEPVLELDAAHLRKHYEDVVDRKQALLEEVRGQMLKDMDPTYVREVFSQGTEGIKKLLMSNDKFADLLRSYGVEPPTKVSLRTNKVAYAFAKTDEAFKELEAHEDERVQIVVGARLGNKTTIEETRTERFIGMAQRGAFPVPLRYYGAHSGRWSGQDKVNLQNLPSRGVNAKQIKKAICAPDGYVVIDCDSAQIEARTLAWLAGQTDLVQAFEAKEDVYKIMAESIYGVPREQVNGQQRQVGKTVILGAGYGVGHVKLQAFLKTQAGVEVSLDEAKRIIQKYRTQYYRIPDLWRSADAALESLYCKQSMTVDAVGIVRAIPGSGLTLPNGLFIQYPNLRNIFDKDKNKYQWTYTSKGQKVYVYGGKCLSASTEVLTGRGWVPIVEVTRFDRVWDGVEWVNHCGLTYQGVKPTIVLNGVRMTADHQVLTEKGWERASSCEGLHGADFWMPDGVAIRGSGTTFHLGVPMRMRNGSDASRDRRRKVREAWRNIVMRVQGWREEYDARYVQPPGVLGMAVNAGSLQATHASSMAQLRSAGDYCVRLVARVVRGVLGRHGADVPSGVDTRPHRQQRGVQPGELPVGDVHRTGGEPPRVAASGHTARVRTDWHTEIDTVVPMDAEPVYDIINAGPRSRFVVRGNAGPIVVHNCVENFTQAIARCVVGEQMLRIAKRYKVALTVHDSVVCVVRKEEADEAQAFIERCMSWRPTWAQGLPLACESGIGDRYGDC